MMFNIICLFLLQTPYFQLHLSRIPHSTQGKALLSFMTQFPQLLFPAAFLTKPASFKFPCPPTFSPASYAPQLLGFTAFSAIHWPSISQYHFILSLFPSFSLYLFLSESLPASVTLNYCLSVIVVSFTSSQPPLPNIVCNLGLSLLPVEVI